MSKPEAGPTVGADSTEAKASNQRRIPIAVKMGVSISLLLALGMAVLAWAIHTYQSSLIHEQVQEFGGVISGQLSAAAREPLFAGEPMELEVLLSSFARSERILGAAAFDHQHKLLAKSGLIPPDNLIDFKVDEQTFSRRQIAKWQGGQRPSFRRATIRISPVTFREVTGGHIVVMFSEDSMTAAYQDSLKAIILITILLCASIIPLTIFMGRRMSRPIQRLVEATEAIGSGGVYRISDRRDDEIGQLIDAINGMGEDLLHKSEVENRLELLLSKDVARKVINNLDTVRVGGEHVEATVLFADIVGFTSISEELTPHEVSDFLNEYFGYLNRCCEFYHGTIDKYIGDSIMVVFGAHKPAKNQQYSALACAVLMQRTLVELNEYRLQEGKFPVQLRIGINSGDMVAGMIGSPERMEYTVVGDAVNLASRLCGEAEGGQIIIEESFYQKISQTHGLEVEEKKEIQIRGKRHPIHIYNVNDIEFEQQAMVDHLVDDLVSNRKLA